MSQGALFDLGQAQYARVAVDRPVRREFSYRVSDKAAEGLAPGCRVRVPFGTRDTIGVVVGIDRDPPAGVAASRIREVSEVLDERPLLTPPLLSLGRWMADTTYCSLGRALSAMIPGALRKGRSRRSVPAVECAREATAAELQELAERWPKQEKALAWLRAAGGPVVLSEFLSRVGLSRSPVQSLAKRGLVRMIRVHPRHDPYAGVDTTPDTPHDLNPAQRRAVDAVTAALDRHDGGGFLLHGITGSGKTEVYLQALDHCLRSGRGAIVLVPEIALTPQTVSRFRARCGEVAVLHSHLTDAERLDQYMALHDGKVRVAVGARSALFAPIPDLGLIVVDEEHEHSFKQENAPRYHARDAALERSRLERAVCILGSATPSLESYTAAREGRLGLLELPERVGGGVVPKIGVVDLKLQKPERGHWLVLSSNLRDAVSRALDRGERAILFLNRRGFAAAWFCRACGASVRCGNCDVAVTYHRWRKKAVCHYCMEESPPPASCPDCGRPVQLVGVGTERAEDAVQRAFPTARVVRMDRDTMVRRESYEEVLGAFGRGEFDILLGTQMVAKGLDFPEVTVVGVLNADIALHHPDFRASERTFGLVSQVAGRAGRSARGGTVVVQTYLPEHAAIAAAIDHDYHRFADAELEERKSFGYPPFGRAIRIEIEHRDRAKADRLAAGAREAFAGLADDAVTLLGPAPPPMERLRGRWRRHILVKTDTRARASLEAVLYGLCAKEGVTVNPL